MKKFLALLLLTIIFIFQAWSANGLNAYYYNDNSSSSNSWTTTPILTQTDPNIDFQWGNNAPATGITADRFSVVWSGYLYVPETSSYTIYVAYDDYIDVAIDGTQLYSNGTWTGGTTNYNNFSAGNLTQGYHTLQVRFKEYGGGAYARVAWKNTSSITAQVIIPQTNFYTVIPPPTITSPNSGNTYAGNVAENTTAVATVVASDPAGSTITYSLSGIDAAKFSINSAGVITFVTAPDFETPTDSGNNNVYNFTVTASNGTLSDTQDFGVTVTDVAETLTPIAEYRMDDLSWIGTGAVTDSIGGDNNGTVTGSTASTTVTSAKLCRSGLFNGAAVDIGSLNVATTPAAKTSVAFWMYWNGTNSVMPFGWRLHDLWFSSTSFGFNTSNGDIYGISSTGLANGWHQVVAVFTNGSVTSNQLYIDGVNQTLTQRVSTPLSTTAVVQSSARIGGWLNDAGYRFKTMLDEIKIFNGALTAAQVQSIYTNENSGNNWDGTTRICPNSAPTISNISLSNITQTTASLNATPSATGTMYYVITSSATPPSATQVKAGQTDTGSTALFSGNSAVTATTATAFNLSGLTSGTTYYAYLVMTDSSSLNSLVYPASPFTTLLPSVSIANPTAITEGNSGTKALTFQITVTNPNSTAITLKVNTADGTATVADNDYVALSNLTLTIPANTTIYNVNVLINGDTNPVEADETFTLTLSTPTNATISNATATGIILNDDMATCSNATAWATLNNYGDTSTTISGSVSNGYDDFFKIIVGVDGKLDITYAADAKTNFYLMDSSCNAIASKTSSTSGTLSYVVDAGTYYLKINRSGNANYSNVKATLSFPNENWKNFELLKQYNTTGAIKAIGNSALCKSSSGAASGTCTAPSNTQGNGSIYSIYTDIDTDSSTTSSSSANLTLPSGATIKWAGLFWNGRLGSGKTTAQKLAAKNIKFKLPGATSYTTVSADNFNWASSAFAYKGYKDVTSLMNKTAPNGTYYVSDIQTALGTNAYAAWSLFVIYELNTETYKNISVYDGFFSITKNGNNALGEFGSKDVPLASFLTPTNGTVNSKLLLFSSEGDVDITGETLSMSNKSGVFTTISNALNPANNVFNSNITENASYYTDRNPAYQNTIGIDLDTFDVSSIMQNAQSSTTIRFTTNQDQYFPAALAFSTELYLPDVCYEEGIYKNGVALNNASVGDILDINVSITNKNIEPAQKVIITKVFDDTMSYVAGSSSINTVSKTDASGDDTVVYDNDQKKLTFNLGTGATALQGGTINKNQIELFKLQTKLLQLGEITSDYAISFSDSAGTTNYTNIAIGKCSKLPPTTITIAPSGVARIVELGKTWSDNNGALFTKVAGATYNYDILFATDEIGTALTSGKIKKLEIWDILTNQLVSTPINTLTTIPQRLSVSIPLLSSYGRLQFKITQEDDKVSTSNDFTVRPAYFTGAITTAQAGVTKSLNDGSIKGYGANNTASNGYSATLDLSNFKALTFPASKICDADQPAEMIDSFTAVITNGLSTAGTITFKDIGDFNISIYDYSWSAKSDDAGNGGCIPNSSSNTPDSNGKIGCNIEGNVNVSVTPYQFTVISAAGGGDWKYMATQVSDQNTSYSGIMEAENNLGNPTLNFSSLCFATSVPSKFNFSLDRASSLFAVDKIGTNLVTPSPKSLSAGNNVFDFMIPSAEFTSGNADFRIDIGMNKNVNLPQNPTLLTAKDFTPNTTSTNIAYSFPANTKSTFLYGRARAYDVTTNFSPTPNPVEFEVYSTTSGGYVSGMPQNVLHWYRNLNHDAANEGKVIQGGFSAGTTDSSINVSTPPTDGLQTIIVTSSVDKTVHLDISPWLWYSSTYSYLYSGPCTQHPCFNYDYTDASAGVKGVNSGTFNGSDFQMAPAKNITNKGVKIFR